MACIGEIHCEKLGENEFLYKWWLVKVDFTNSYWSPNCDTLPFRNISDFQLAIVPDKFKHVVKFFLFLYGYEGRSGPKMIFNPCLMVVGVPKYKVSCPDLCLELGTSMKIFEIHSSHPILFKSNEYYFQLRINLYEDSTITPSFSSINTFAQDTKENGRALEIIPRNGQYLNKLSQDMGSLYTSGDLCDLEIRIGEDTLRVHKLILCARSPVFKAMMEHDFLESSSNSITITDCPTPSFVKFLKYLYTGEIEGGTIDTVMSLYSLGDKYDMPVLRESCSEMLQSKLSSDEFVDDVANIVCDVLQLAECHGDSKMKDLAASFIVNHFPVVSSKQGWKDLVKSNSELISNILVLVASGLHKQVCKTVNT
nr:speckle-type POZ protein-like [Parasteatoda tepidariorum]